MPDARRTNNIQPPSYRLTQRQHSVALQLAQGYDIATVAEHRGRGISSTYEIATRICERLGLSEWHEIGPWMVEHGWADLDGHDPEQTS